MAKGTPDSLKVPLLCGHSAPGKKQETAKGSIQHPSNSIQIIPFFFTLS
jgi:hypothetical protein